MSRKAPQAGGLREAGVPKKRGGILSPQLPPSFSYSNKTQYKFSKTGDMARTLQRIAETNE